MLCGTPLSVRRKSFAVRPVTGRLRSLTDTLTATRSCRTLKTGVCWPTIDKPKSALTAIPSFTAALPHGAQKFANPPILAVRGEAPGIFCFADTRPVEGVLNPAEGRMAAAGVGFKGRKGKGRRLAPWNRAERQRVLRGRVLRAAGPFQRTPGDEAGDVDRCRVARSAGGAPRMMKRAVVSLDPQVELRELQVGIAPDPWIVGEGDHRARIGL